MDAQRQNFLMAVLGAEGATMLIKAVDKNPVLERALLPRTILAWLQAAPRYEGDLPGNQGRPVSFEKSEAGFTGEVSMGEEIYKFEGVSVFHVGASVAVALGIEEPPSEDLRDLDIERLGKTIDAFAKVKRVNDELDLQKSDDKDSDDDHSCKDLGGPEECADIDCKDCQKLRAEKAELMDKAAGTGVPAAPTPPTPPAAPAAAAPKPTKPSVSLKPPKTAAMTLQRSEVEHKCPACGGLQFRDDRFVGCICFRALNKAIRVTSSSAEGLTVEMDMRILDSDDVATFREAIGR